ncbi:MAG: hypothetical protein JWQ42_2426 [Edaphobacter sp.]|nr:hypothetical protein [Edaphobacter sp.]
MPNTSFFSLRTTARIGVLCILVLATSSSAGASTFTVKDAIGMQKFVDPYPFHPYSIQREDAKFSPDNRFFAVVTQRGLVATNELESTIWVFDVNDVGRFLSNSLKVAPPVPTRVAKAAAVTNDLTITQLRWISNQKLAFLGRHKSSKNRLFTIDVKTRVLKGVTPDWQDVTQFDIVNDTVAYTSAIREPKVQRAPEVVLTGQSILPLLDSESPDDFTVLSKPAELWIIRDRETSPVRDRSTGKPIKLVTEMLSLSPSGSYVAVTQHADHIPLAWEAYEPFPGPLSNFIRLKASPAAIGTEGLLYRLGMPEQYALIDLHSGDISPIAAPIGETLNYFSPKKAVWGHDGNQVLLLNTFLPMDGLSEVDRLRRAKQPCVALLDTASGNTTCVAGIHQSQGEWFSKDGTAFRATDLMWNESVGEVVISYTTYGNENRATHVEHAPEAFRSEGTGWARVKHSAALDRPPFWTGIRQDLNEPPALFVANWASSNARKLWDPNPQLKGLRLGETSVYKWRDSSGRNWAGGLVKPPDYIPGKRYPLVIQTHGFNQHEFMTIGPFMTAFAARPLAGIGIMVLQLEEQRDVDLTPQEAEVNAGGYDSAIEHLSADGLVDPARVGLIGFSRTGYYVLEALTKNRHRFAAATIADSDFLGYMQRLLDVDAGPDDSYKKEGVAIYGSQPFGEGLKTWVQKAPAFNLDKVITPVRIEVHDMRTLLHDWELYAGLRLQAKPVDLIQLPDAVHEVTKPLERLASEQGDVDWFDFWLNGHEDPDANKAEQYARWRMFRKQPSDIETNPGVAGDTR